jgi:DNA-directed RNA polymerase subunit H (RpoH/RPB5)
MITQDMVRDFWGKLNDCNNIRGFIVSTNEPQEEAKQLLKYYGIEVITEDELPNIPGLLLAHTKCLVPDENVQGDPFWTIMQLTEDGKNTGSYYSYRKTLLRGH